MNVRKNQQNDKPDNNADPIVKKTWRYDIKDVVDDYEALLKHSITMQGFGTRDIKQYKEAVMVGQVEEFFWKGNLCLAITETDRDMMSEGELAAEFREARNWYYQGLLLAEQHKHVELLCDAICYMAKAYKKEGQDERAMKLYSKASALAPEYYAKNAYLCDLPVIESETGETLGCKF